MTAAALIQFEDTDASGEPRLIADDRVTFPTLRITSVFDTTPALRRHVWREQHGLCGQCGQPVMHPDVDACFLLVPDVGFRMTCKEREAACFKSLVAQINPAFDTAAAEAREQDAAEVVRDLRLVTVNERRADR